MSKFEEKRFQIGEYWLATHISPIWKRCWYDNTTRQVKRETLSETNFELTKEKLIDWYMLTHQRKNEAPKEVPLSEIFSRYYEHHGKKLKSHDLIRLSLKYWLEFHDGKTVEEAAAIVEQERFQHWLINLKGLKPNSANRIVSNGKTAINWAWKQGEIDRVPYFKPVQNIGVVPPRGRPMDMTEVAEMIKQAVEPHLVDFIVLMIATASRPDAIYDLTFERCDMENRLIVLNPADRAQTKKYRPTTKFPEQLVPYVKKLEARSRCSSVVSYKDAPVKSIRTTWRRTRELAGLDNQVNPYSLRHTMARYLRSQGVSAWQVSSQLGHKQQGMSTSEIYAPFSPDHLSEATIAIDLYLKQLACRLRVDAICDLIT